jgi:alpha-L-fucosidase
VLQNLEELWGGSYGNDGNLTELWFDGGISLPGVGPHVKDLVAKYQPQTVAGAAEYAGGNISTLVTEHPLRWVGNEAGGGADPQWSFGPIPENGPGHKDVIWAPVEADTTLQIYDSWWYHEPSKGGTIGVRTLAELQTVYHSTVGQNAFLEMDFAPTPEGLIAPDQVKRYKEFGDWIRACYEGPGLLGRVEHPLGRAPAGDTQLLTFDPPAMIDRVVVREDQTEGQAIRAWEVHAQALRGGAWSKIANGTSMGNKWIKLLDENITVCGLKTVVTATASGGTAKLRALSGHRCARATTYAQVRQTPSWPRSCANFSLL